MSSLICPNCNYKAKKDESFCSQCGTKLKPTPKKNNVKKSRYTNETDDKVEAKVSKVSTRKKTPGTIKDEVPKDSVAKKAPIRAKKTMSNDPLESPNEKAVCCRQCGMELDSLDIFCGNCGTPVRIITAKERFQDVIKGLFLVALSFTAGYIGAFIGFSLAEWIWPSKNNVGML